MSIDNNDENNNFDLDDIKNKLLSDQSKYLEEQNSNKPPGKQQPETIEEIGKTLTESKIQTLREENPDLSLEDWTNTLLEKRRLLNQKVSEYFPTMELLLDFELSVKTILNIQDITLSFMGIVFAVPSSLKTAFFKFLRNIWYSYYTE